jgi:tetratricopeptide (TPR) repeat protein
MEKKQELEIREDDEILAKTRKAERVSNSYIQNLYRFYRLFPSKDAFESPFDYSLKLHDSVIAQLAAFDDDDRIEIAEYCFSKGFYEAAFGLFNSVKTQLSLEYYQKLGYCKQKVGDMVEAIAFYKQAEVIEPNDVWTLLRLAYCHKKMSEFKLAAEYYAKAEALQPNKSAISFKKALCQLECGEENEALAIFFKIDYETSGNSRLWRLITMTSIALMKFDQAERYVEKLMSGKDVEWEDYVIEAYVKWIKNDMAGTVAALRAARKQAKAVRLVEDRMEADKGTLQKAGLDVNLIPLLVDASLKE